jgi:hypothetical protein
MIFNRIVAHDGINTGVLGVLAALLNRIVGPTPLTPALIDFKNNSVNFARLQTLEEKIAALRCELTSIFWSAPTARMGVRQSPGKSIEA